MATAMNALGYDAFVIGNHEFDWGVDVLGEMIEKMEAPPLAANLLAGEEAPAAFQRVLPYVVKEVDGLKVAIVGLTTPNIPNWFRACGRPRPARGGFAPRAGSHAPAGPEGAPADPDPAGPPRASLAEDDDANEINGICRRFGEFDLVLGGHLHWVLPGGANRQSRLCTGRLRRARRDADRPDLRHRRKIKWWTRNSNYLPVTRRLHEDRAIAGPGG